MNHKDMIYSFHVSFTIVVPYAAVIRIFRNKVAKLFIYLNCKSLNMQRFDISFFDMINGTFGEYMV